MVLLGGGEAAATLARLDLIDDYRLFVHPVLQGQGKRLFPGDLDRRNLNLLEARAPPASVVRLTYRRGDDA